jgi:hypothetical protein
MVHPGPYLGPFPWCTRVPCTQRSQGSAESWGLPVLAAGTPDGHFRCAMAVTAMSGTLVFGAGAGHRFQILTLPLRELCSPCMLLRGRSSHVARASWDEAAVMFRD